MMYLPQLLALAGVWAIVVMSPGPDFVATVHHAASRSRRDGLFVALGIAASTTIWVAVSILGLGVLFARFSWLVEIIRMVGALYLTFLGLRMLWKTHRNRRKPEPENACPKPGSAWRVGFLTDLSNPKAAAFFSSLFAVFLPTHTPAFLLLASAAAIVMIAACWYATIACVFSFGPIARGYARIRKWIDYVTGGVLVALGIRLAVSR